MTWGVTPGQLRTHASVRRVTACGEQSEVFAPLQVTSVNNAACVCAAMSCGETSRERLQPTGEGWARVSWLSRWRSPV